MNGFYSSINYTIIDNDERVVTDEVLKNKNRDGQSLGGETGNDQRKTEEFSSDDDWLELIRTGSHSERNAGADRNIEKEHKTAQSMIDIKIYNPKLWFPLSMATGKDVANRYTLKVFDYLLFIFNIVIH